MTIPTLTPASDAEVIRLVAGRELSVRLRSKAFRVVTLVMIAIVVVLPVVLKLVHDNNSTTQVGYLPANNTLAQQLPAIADTLGKHVTITAVPDQSTGEQRVRSGDLAALLIGTDTHVGVVVKKNIDGDLQKAVNILAADATFDQQVVQLGGNPARIRASTAQATATVHSLDPPFPYQPQQLLLGIITGVLIFISLQLNGQTIAQGVVEEKSSRVVELLLATIRPWQLMAGKVLGIGLVGLIQILAIGIAGVGAGLATKVLTISASAAAGTVIWLVAWYLLGFFMYAVLFAALGALVSRPEDIGGAVAPAMIFLIIAYILGVSILPNDPSSTLIEIMSIIPMFAPILMPMRLVIGGVPVWETIASAGIVIALIPMLIWLAARIYRNAVLRTGAKVPLRQALRAA